MKAIDVRCILTAKAVCNANAAFHVWQDGLLKSNTFC